MKKLLLALPLIAGGSWAGASYFTGTQTQDAYDQMLEQLNEFGVVTLVNDDYVAGMVNSTAITNVMASAAPDAPVLFRLHHAIHHSPVGMNNGAVRVGPATITTTLVRDGTLPEPVQHYLQGFAHEQPVQINTMVSFDGSMTHRMLVGTFEHQNEELNLRFAGMDFTLQTDADSLQGEGTTGELVISADDYVLRLTPGQIQSDFALIDQSFLSGGYSVSFDKLTASGPSMPVSVALKAIDLSSDTSVDGDKFGFNTRYAIGSIDTPLPLTSASLDMRVTELSVSGMENYFAAVTELGMADPSSEILEPQVEAVLKAAMGIIGSGTGLAYDIELGNEGGKANLLVAANVVDESSPNYPAEGLTSLVTLRDVLNALQFELRLHADAAAVDQSPLAMFMGMPEAQQFIVSDGVTYQSDITVQDLLLDINGNPLSLEMMLGEVLDMPLASAMAFLP